MVFNDINELKEKVLIEKIKLYKKKYGENYAIELARELENSYQRLGSGDYAEITYFKNESPKHILILGDLTDFLDNLLMNINSKYEMILNAKIKGNYQALVSYKKEEYL